MFKNLYQQSQLKAYEAQRVLNLKVQFLQGQHVKRVQFLKQLTKDLTEKGFETKKAARKAYSDAVVAYDREVQEMFNNIFNKQEVEGEV